MSSRFQFLRPKKTGYRTGSALDYKLVQKVRSHTIPRPSQLKYLFRFLSPFEKIVFNVCLTVALLSILGLSGKYLSDHLSTIPKEGGEYSEALIGEPKYINPIFASASDVDQDLSSLVYAGLFRYSKSGELIPDIAESFEIATDTKTYDIKLKNNIKFADGEPLTAGDVLYTFDLIQNPEVSSPLFPAFQGVKIERVNDYEVRFILKAPFAPFLHSLTVGILPEHLWADISPAAIRLTKNNLQPIGAGAWQFSKLVKDAGGRIDSLTLMRNDKYYSDKSLFKTLRFKFFTDYSGALEALRSQSVDALSFLPDVANLKINNRNIGFYNFELPEYTAIFFNQTYQPILKNDDVRLALFKAIDKDKIVREALSGFGKTIVSPFLPGQVGYNPTLTATSSNPEDANALLDKKWNRVQPEDYFDLRYNALTKELAKSSSTTVSEVDKQRISDLIRAEMSSGQEFYRKDKDNNILQITLTTADSEEYSRVAALIAKMWENIGVKVNIQKMSPNRLVREAVKNRTYDAVLYSEIVGADPDPYPFWHASQTDYPGLNLSLYSDRTVDKLLEDARATVDNKQRANLYQKFQTELTKNIPAIFLYSPLHTMAINKEIRGVSLDTINSPADRYADLSHWYVKTALKWK